MSDSSWWYYDTSRWRFSILHAVPCLVSRAPHAAVSISYPETGTMMCDRNDATRYTYPAFSSGIDEGGRALQARAPKIASKAMARSLGQELRE